MPIYEYRCDACGQELEKLQRMSDEKLVDCPACNEPALKRLVSAAAFRLKGSGWYETDFKKDNKRNLAGEDSETVSKDAAGKKTEKSPEAAKSDKKVADKKPAKKSAKMSGKANTT